MKDNKKILDYKKLETIANLLKTVSHPIRLEILEALSINEPLSVNEIRKKIKNNIEQSMLSHHLIKMKDKGVLTSYKNGKNIYYKILDRNILNIFDCLGSCEAIK